MEDEEGNDDGSVSLHCTVAWTIALLMPRRLQAFEIGGKAWSMGLLRDLHAGRQE